jgi:hypothetical protein
MRIVARRAFDERDAGHAGKRVDLLAFARELLAVP